MKRYAVFVARFALVPMISGTFVVSTNGTAALIEWAHIIAGFATIYLIIGLLLRSAMHRELRLPAALALLLGLMEAIPGMPRFHAALSPVLFTVLVWASVRLPAALRPATAQNLQIFVLPALVLAPIFYGVGYRHQTSGLLPHLSAAVIAAGVLIGFCMFMNEKTPVDANFHAVSNMTIAAVLFQIVAGITAMVIRMLNINGGLALGMARTAHITGAGALLAVSMLLAIRYQRRAA